MNKKHRVLSITLSICAVVYLAVLGLQSYDKADLDDTDNVTLTISCKNKKFKQGEEIPVTFKIKNNRKTPFPYLKRAFVRSGRWDEYKLIARRENGTVVLDPMFNWAGTVGGPGSRTTLEPGESIVVIIALNEWALISEPGHYKVVGIFTDDLYKEKEKQILIRSKPIEIIIEARSDKKMVRYIESLSRKLKSAKEREEIYSISRKLMFTRDNRIVPALIDCEYSEKGEGTAAFILLHYLPIEKETRDIILHASKQRGLVEATVEALQRFGCADDEWKDLITLSLGSKNPRCVAAGAKAAQTHPDDSHMTRLIEIATDEDKQIIVRKEAIYAIAQNRTNEGVAILKQLLEHSDENIREKTNSAIERAYWLIKIYETTFKNSAYKKSKSVSELIDVATSRDNLGRWEAIEELLWISCRRRLEAVPALLEGTGKDNIKEYTDEVVKAIQSLLRDPNKDVQDLVITFIREISWAYPGRPLREDDFIEISELITRLSGNLSKNNK